MPRMTPVAAATALTLMAATLAAQSQTSQSQTSQSAPTKGAVELTGRAPVPQNPTLPALNLTNAQRETIRRAVVTRHTDAEFKLKDTKSDADFTPALGEKLAKGLSPVSLPLPVVRAMPQLADYKYLTVKDKVLIVNPMSGKIVDMFSESQPVT